MLKLCSRLLFIVYHCLKKGRKVIYVYGTKAQIDGVQFREIPIQLAD